MNEWASKFMSVLPNNNPKTDFNKFIKEKDFDEDIETRPTYEQISLELILDEANKNILLLKSLEYILTERVQAYQQFFNTLSKAKASFDVFQHCEGSLRQSLDSFYLFVEQELQQARQQISLSDIRRSLSEMKVEAQKKLNDYMKEIANAEKDVNNCEKKLLKSKEQLDKYMDIRTNSSNPVDRRKQSLHLEEAVSWLAYGTESQQGRDIFITELNKFRSKKVDISEGFLALDLLMTTLTSDDEDDEGSRVVGRREYIKDLLLLHPIWQEGQFWELVLRDCAYEQLQTIPYDIAWYDLDKDKREEMVQRVHNVIFSQRICLSNVCYTSIE
eukprot:gene20475-26565_t